MSRPILVFDLDGTLVDTAPDLVETLNTILRARRSRAGALRRREVDDRRRREGNARTRAANAERGRLRLRELDRMFADFIAHYAAHIADTSRPFPGLDTALDRLADKGFVFAVCTNKLEWLSRRLLDALDLARRFAFICGQDTFGVKKPDPAILRLTIERAGGKIADAVMVGDSAADIDTARAAGIPVIAVDFGYTEIPVAAMKPDLIISHFDALPAAVVELRQRT